MKCIGLKFQTLDLDCRTHSFKYKKSGFKDIKDSNIRIHIVQETLGVLFCWSKMENMFRFVKYMYSVHSYKIYIDMFRFVKYLYSIYISIYIQVCQVYIQYLYLYSFLSIVCTASIYIFRFAKYMYSIYIYSGLSSICTMCILLI